MPSRWGQAWVLPGEHRPAAVGGSQGITSRTAWAPVMVTCSYLYIQKQPQESLGLRLSGQESHSGSLRMPLSKPSAARTRLTWDRGQGVQRPEVPLGDIKFPREGAAPPPPARVAPLSRAEQTRRGPGRWGWGGLLRAS